MSTNLSDSPKLTKSTIYANTKSLHSLSTGGPVARKTKLGFLKLSNLHMPLKQKSPSLPRNVALGTCGELLKMFSTKVNLLFLFYSTGRRFCLLHLIKENCLLKTSENSNLDHSDISLPVFPSKANLTLHNISVIHNIVKKVVTNLDSSKTPSPVCIPVAVLKKCEPELSYILAELFNMCLKESCFPDCWKVSSVVPVFTNVGKKSTAKNYRSVSLRSVISKVFEKLVNNRIVDHLKKCGLFSDFLKCLLDQLQLYLCI